MEYDIDKVILECIHRLTIKEAKNINTSKAPLYITSSIEDICLTMKKHHLNSVKVSYDSSINTYIFGDTYNFVHWSLISCAIRNGLYPNFEFKDDDDLCIQAIDYCCDLDNFAISTIPDSKDLISDDLVPDDKINVFGVDYYIYHNPTSNNKS